ncbi:MAG: HAMP domain-containing protein [Treponema sp.]|nr:HAMP domain-containing protein [Treponema sp.]
MSQNNTSGLMKIRFSIGAKLIIIITFIVLVSLGSIIALASWLVRADLQIIAEENNFETNRRTAMTADSAFEYIHSNSLILIRTITSVGPGSFLAYDSAEFYFERNPQAASVFFTMGDSAVSANSEFLINADFFETRNIDPALADTFRTAQAVALRRAVAGETVLINAARHFGAPLLALFFPWQQGGAGVVFDPMDLNETFGYGVNQSYLINDAGDVLIHADFDMVRNAVNVADRSYTKYVWNRIERDSQTLYTDEEGTRYFGAFTKLNTAGAIVITSVEYNKVFESINATTRRNIYLTITVLSISIIFIWFFAKSISIPLRILAVAAQDIEGGKFELSLTPKGRDEIALLTDSFLRMCKALNIFGRFTNRDIAVRAMRGEIKPGGFPKNATIFFSDIRGFTSISENFTNTFGDEASDKIVYWLNNYFTRMVDCVERTSGVVDKFIGDALMAHWGTAYTSGSIRKDAYNCISSAIMMRKALYRMNQVRKKGDPSNPRIQFGCGINTGMVTAGQLGSDVRMEYTVIGDPVNLASRVEALNKPFGTDILIAEDTWRLVRKKFITVEMPSVKVKGKENPVRVFAVINYAKNPKGPKSLPRLRRMLGIKAPENLKIDTNSSEIKYKITGKK